MPVRGDCTLTPSPVSTFCSTPFELAGVTSVQHILSNSSRFNNIDNNINGMLSFNVLTFQVFELLDPFQV